MVFFLWRRKFFAEQMELYYSRNRRSEFELCRALTHLVRSGQGTFLLKTTDHAVQDNLTASIAFSNHLKFFLCTRKESLKTNYPWKSLETKS